jgi:polysaccharide biosynthesis/export protein
MSKRLQQIGLTVCAALVASLILQGCASSVPTIGPSRRAIEQETSQRLKEIQIVDVSEPIVRELRAQRTQQLFSQALGNTPPGAPTVGAGDVLEVTIWEAAPATLFGSTLLEPSGAIATSHATTLPEQTVSSDGFISVPFAGRIAVGGKTLEAVQSQIVLALNGKAHAPEVIVRMIRNLAATATVVGEVTTSTRVPLNPGSERLLDAIAAAAGVRQPVNKTTIQVTRADNVYSLPLETIIRDPRQNIPLLPGDVITALFQPYSFTALGASGKNEEINFETQGISLAQALARSGGLIDSRSNPRGVFIFRFEKQGALEWPNQPVRTTADGLVPVVYRFDLSDPASFFLIQSFPVENSDILYVSNAPITELQKYLNILFSVAYPVLTAKQVGF